MSKYKPTFQFFLVLTTMIGFTILFTQSFPTFAATKVIQTAFTTHLQSAGPIIETADNGANFFTPSTATIKVGETVTFTNTGGGFHNVDFDSTFPGGSVPDGFVADSSSTAEWSRSVTFSEPGDYYFFCTPHQAIGMVGRITVEANPQEVYLPLIVRYGENR